TGPAYPKPGRGAAPGLSRPLSRSLTHCCPLGSVIRRRDDLATGPRAQRAPRGCVDGLLDEPDRAVEQKDVHSPGVVAGRRVEHMGVTAATDAVDMLGRFLPFTTRKVVWRKH